MDFFFDGTILDGLPPAHFDWSLDGIPHGFPHGLLYGLPYSILGGFPDGLFDLFSITFLRCLSGEFAYVHPEGFPHGLLVGFRDDFPDGFPYGIPGGLPDGIPGGPPHGRLDEYRQGLSNEFPDGILDRLPYEFPGGCPLMFLMLFFNDLLMDILVASFMDLLANYFMGVTEWVS